MTSIWLKQFAEKYLPGPAVKLARLASRRLADRRYRQLVRHLQQSHRIRNVGLPPEELRLRNGLVLKVTPEARETYEYFCYRDPEIVREFDQFIRLSVDNLRLLDIGAEHGFFALAFTRSGPSRRAVAVEPSPVGFPVLAAQLRLNPEANVTPLNIAVGEAEGQLEMAVRGTHAVTAFGFYGDLPLERRTIQVRRVDDICRDLDFEPDLVKIDVEGYELHVLHGARETLEKFSPLLLLEVHPGMIDALGQSVPELLTYLADCGYSHMDPETGLPSLLKVSPTAGSLRVVFRKYSPDS